MSLKAPNTYTAEDCLVWTHSEKINLILKRLEAPGSREVWWGGGGKLSLLEDGGGGRKYGM